MDMLFIMAIVAIIVYVGVIVHLSHLLRRDDEAWWARYVKSRQEDGQRVERTADWQQIVGRQRVGMRVTIGIMGVLIIFMLGIMVWWSLWRVGVLG